MFLQESHIVNLIVLVMLLYPPTGHCRRSPIEVLSGHRQPGRKVGLGGCLPPSAPMRGRGFCVAWLGISRTSLLNRPATRTGALSPHGLLRLPAFQYPVGIGEILLGRRHVARSAASPPTWGVAPPLAEEMF